MNSSTLSDPAQNPGPTVKDVAALAGVSTATVSRVLNDKGGVSKQLEKRVRQAIKALDYHPNQAARRLRERSSKTIGVLVPDIEIPFFASIIVGIEEALEEAGYLLLLGNTKEDSTREQRHIKKFLAEDVSGIIFAPSNSKDIANYRKLKQSNIPLVAIDRSPGDLEVDTVQVANMTAASRAVSHFIQEGHQRIAMITGPDHINTAVERLAGYEQTLRTAGLPYRPEWVQNGDYQQSGGYNAMRRLLETPIPPTAVLIANNIMTLGALQYIHEQNLEIPCDIALISFDDMPWASSLRPPLTVVAQPVHEIGAVAARLVLERIQDPSISIKHVTLETKLVLRASCNCGGDHGKHNRE